MRFTEVADRVFVAAYDAHDVNVSVVVGSDGMLVVDTHASAAEARGVVEDLEELRRAMGLAAPVAVANTHDHFDHVMGNSVFRGHYGGLPIYAHEDAAALTDPAAPPADHTVSSAAALDLGDRFVELVHPGRGHTAGDLVVRVPDADVLLAGDLVENASAGEPVPAFGDDCFPLEWPATLDLLVGLLTSGSVVVPGHGPAVDLDFVTGQQSEIATVAQTIADLAANGVPAGQALDHGEWPYPVDRLSDAVARAYAHLPRGAKRLPLA